MADRSLVAGVNALFRAVETQRSAAVRILDDPFAARLCENNPAVWLLRLLRFGIPPLARAIEEQLTAHCVRHRAIDALVVEALADGFRQVVLLGAGYDTRASRLRAQGVRWFEVDRAAISRRKAQRLADVSGVNREVVYVAADLRDGAALPELCDASFDPTTPSVFVIEGVLHYLSNAAIERLLAETSAGPGRRRLILSFIEPAMVRRASGTFRWMIRVLGEVPENFFTPEALETLAARFGWGGARHWTGVEQARAFAPQAEGRSCGLTQVVGCFDSAHSAE